MLCFVLIAVVDFLSGIQAYAGSVAVTNISMSSSTQLTLITPPVNETGYHVLTLLNTDGGSGTLSPGLYYTDDCPYEGTRSISKFDYFNRS